MDSNRKKISRIFGRQYLVKNTLQLKFCLMIAILLMILALTLWLAGGRAILQLVKDGLVNDEIIIGHLQKLNYFVFKVFLAAMAACFGISIMISNFVAGPIYRFEQVLKKMEEGDISMIIKLRKYDELKDTAEIFNRALASLRQKIEAERNGEKFSIRTD